MTPTPRDVYELGRTRGECLRLVALAALVGAAAGLLGFALGAA